MASDEDADDVDEELARVERQLQELDRQAGEVPEPEAPEPGDTDVEAPRPEEAFEGEPDVEEDEGPVDRLLGRVRDLRSSEEDEDADNEPPEAGAEGEGETDEGGGLPFFGKDREDEDQPDDSADGEDADPEEEAAEDEPGEAETEELEASAAQEPAPEPEPASSDEDGEGSLLGGLRARLGSEDEPEASAPATTEPAFRPPPPSARGARTPGIGAGEEDDAARASALLARFQGAGSGDPEDPPPADEEDDDDGGLVVPVIVAVLLLAGLALAAYVILGGSPAGGDVSADLVSDSFTNDEGSYVATVGQPLALDASASTGPVEEYAWDFGDGTQETTSEPTVEHTYEDPGSYSVEVTVSGSGGQDTGQIDVLVLEAPSAEPRILEGGEPAAEPSTIGNNVFVGERVTLDGSASTADPDHTLTSYTWDVDGDGEPDATGRTAELSFEGPGRWPVELTVSDDLGNENTATRALHVSDRRVVEETIGPSTTEPARQNHSVAVDEGREGATPVQLDVRLTYNASSNDTGDLPVQPEIDTDLDLNVTDPEGNVHEADDDDGEGEERLTLAGTELANLGEWTVNVRQDNQNAGTASEVDYELVIETVY